MKVITLIVLLVLAVSTYSQKLEKVWTTETTLTTNESALYNEDLDLVFVTCMGPIRNEVNGDGFISQINLDGEIVKLKWLTGLNDPKGMAIRDGKMYVSDLTELLVVDIKTATVEKRYTDPEGISDYFNDVTVTDDGKVFVTFSHGKHIYSLIDGDFKMWLSDPVLESINGIWAKGDKLYGGFHTLVEIDIETKAITELIQDAGGIDGIETLGNDRFIYSNWAGRVWVAEKGKAIKLLDTSEEELQAADLDYIPGKNLVLLPTFFGNKVVAYKLIW